MVEETFMNIRYLFFSKCRGEKKTHDRDGECRAVFSSHGARMAVFSFSSYSHFSECLSFFFFSLTQWFLNFYDDYDSRDNLLSAVSKIAVITIWLVSHSE